MQSTNSSYSVLQVYNKTSALVPSCLASPHFVLHDRGRTGYDTWQIQNNKCLAGSTQLRGPCLVDYVFVQHAEGIAGEFARMAMQVGIHELGQYIV